MASRMTLQRAVAAVALGAVVLGAAGFATARHASQSGSATRFEDVAHVLNYPNNDSSSWPATFDPANVTDSQTIMVMYMLYDNLVKLSTANKVLPDLAKSWDVSGGGKVYTFHLRTDARFSDGNPITADDVIYSLDRALNPKVLNGKAPSPVALLYLGHIVGAASYKGTGDVKGLKKIDAHTVQITLDSPIAFFLQTLSYPTGDVLEKGKTPIGSLTTKDPMKNQYSSGPFVISKYSYKNTLTFVPNKYFFDYKKMKLKEVDMPFIASEDTMYQGYESGQYAMTVVPASRLAAARSQSDFHSGPQLAIDYITYDTTRPPFNNKDLRLATSYAVNRDLINKDVLHGEQTTIYSIVPKGIPGYDADGKGHVPGYDINKAKMYLARAKKEMGAKFPSSLTIKYQSGVPGLQHEYTELQYEWKQIGLKVNVQSIAFNDWLSLVTKPTPSLSYKGEPWVENAWLDDYPDAQDFTTNLLAPTSSYNVGDYDNPQFEKLITEALTARGSERSQLYIKASRIVLNDVAWTMIGQTTENFRWHNNIKGMVVWSGGNNPEPKDLDWTQVDVQ